MRFFEYRSQTIHNDDYNQRKLQEALNEWGKEGWEVLSVIVPNHHNYDTYQVTAKREILALRTSTGRKFR